MDYVLLELTAMLVFEWKVEMDTADDVEISNKDDGGILQNNALLFCYVK